MAAFAELHWQRLDVTAIVTYSGLATIAEEHRRECREWLFRQGYEIDTFDCRFGLAVAIPKLGRLLRWEEQFGYALGPNPGSLDALRDGFDFEISPGGGRVFEIIRPDLAWMEEPRWTCGLLAIIQEHCREQLALGRRFFGLLVMPPQSPFIGTVVEEMQVPGPHSRPGREFQDSGS